MKAFAIYIRYISLPLCGGLILTLYLYIQAAKHPKENKPSTEKVMGKNSTSTSFSFLDDVASIFIPALKSHDTV
ncbi:MAG: hypothetical protein V4560_11065 [Bacteroidota bacterium]